MIPGSPAVQFPRTIAVQAAATLVALLASPPDHAQTVAPCSVRLQVQLSPEVPSARDPGFLSSLAGSPGYRLVWVRALKEQMSVLLELTGPGPAYRCEQEAARIAHDARVINLRVLPSPRVPQS